MNSPLDAHLNQELISIEEAHNSGKSPDRTRAEEKTFDKQQEEQRQQQEADLKALRKMLVVDDLPVNRKLISIQLQKLGFEVEHAENGQIALEKVRTEDYALVFLDLDMPVMDGYQTAIEIRQHDLETRQHTPIVALSSFNKQTEKERCVSSGIDELAYKGISGRKLQDVITRRIRKTGRPTIAQSGKNAANKLNPNIEIDFQLPQDATGKIDETVVDLCLGALKTIVGCLKCALEDQDLESIEHFARSIDEPSARLGLKSMTRLSARILSDTNKPDWVAAKEGMELLESQYFQILDQLTGLTATLHRIDHHSTD